jgi:hypothetical protein
VLRTIPTGLCLTAQMNCHRIQSCPLVELICKFIDNQMNTKQNARMDNELHLPWENDALQSLLGKIIQTGETTKVDFKRQLNISTGEHHAELLKDISALANTYDYSYKNHGFIILGVTDNKLVHTQFDQNADGLQARIDELLKNYVEPFIPTQVRLFGSGNETWGVLIVPPTRTAPHVFVKDICKRCRGDIFVRRGTTTDKATPSDYVRFFRLHLDEHTYALREQLEDVKRELNILKKRPPVVFKQSEKKTPSPVVKDEPKAETPVNSTNTLASGATYDLLKLIDSAFAQEVDPIAQGLIKEAQKIQKFLVSDAIPWSLNHVNKEVGKKQLDEMEKSAMPFWTALGNLAHKDDKGKYDSAIIRALACLAQLQNAPSGVSFTDWGLNFRYLPLVVSLYLVFITAAFKKRYSLLKQILELPLANRSPYGEHEALPPVLFYLRRASQVFATQHPGYPNQTWFDAVGSVIESIIQRALNIDDPFWNSREAYFIGEFILCLSPLDVMDRDTQMPLYRHPSNGLYLYMSEANPILKKFLRSEAKGVAQIFQRPFQEILANFDTNVAKITTGYWAYGFAGGALKEAFPELASKKDTPA